MLDKHFFSLPQLLRSDKWDNDFCLHLCQIIKELLSIMCSKVIWPPDAWLFTIKLIKLQKKHAYLPASFLIMADIYIKYKALYIYILHIFSMNRQMLDSWKVLLIYLKNADWSCTMCQALYQALTTTILEKTICSWPSWNLHFNGRIN